MVIEFLSAKRVIFYTLYSCTIKINNKNILHLKKNHFPLSIHYNSKNFEFFVFSFDLLYYIVILLSIEAITSRKNLI